MAKIQVSEILYDLITPLYAWLGFLNGKMLRLSAWYTGNGESIGEICDFFGGTSANPRCDSRLTGDVIVEVHDDFESWS